MSCGFHYPVNIYKELILKHSHPETRIVMDLRVMYKKTGMLETEEGVKIIDIFNRRPKYVMAELELS